MNSFAVTTVGVVALVAAGAGPAAAAAPAATSTPTRAAAAADPVGVPAVLDVHRYDPTATLVLDATVQLGVQVYECEATSSAAPGWVLLGPQALLGASGGGEIYHSFGPRWQFLADGSAVTGTVVARAPSASAAAVPQLLLSAVPDPATPAGTLTGVRWIQRLNTHRGTPDGVCDIPRIGVVTAASYSAHYFFWAP